MARAKTLFKQKESSRKISKQERLSSKSVKQKEKYQIKANAELESFSPTENLLNEEFIAKTAWDCLINNDPEGFLEVLDIHLNAIKRYEAASQSKTKKCVVMKIGIPKARKPTSRSSLAKIAEFLSSTATTRAT